mmetsp:Transcript_106280/g.298979  ORF Transcript_106280/g.298979 Transcript_106280/m.298979 type:complete len:359 (+) Transcript_106280:364-1440(+)
MSRPMSRTCGVCALLVASCSPRKLSMASSRGASCSSKNSVRSSSSHHSNEAWRTSSRRAVRRSRSHLVARSRDSSVTTLAERVQIGRHMRSCLSEESPLEESSTARAWEAQRACAADFARKRSSSVMDSYSKPHEEGVAILLTMCCMDFSSCSGNASTRSARQCSFKKIRTAGPWPPPSALSGRPLNSATTTSGSGGPDEALAAIGPSPLAGLGVSPGASPPLVAFGASPGPLPGLPPTPVVVACAAPVVMASSSGSPASALESSSASRNCASSMWRDAAPRPSSGPASPAALAAASSASCAAKATASAASNVGVTLKTTGAAASPPVAPSLELCSWPLKWARIISQCALLCHLCTVS